MPNHCKSCVLFLLLFLILFIFLYCDYDCFALALSDSFTHSLVISNQIKRELSFKQPYSLSLGLPPKSSKIKSKIKQVCYFQSMQRLQRWFMTTETALSMWWHEILRIKDEKVKAFNGLKHGRHLMPLCGISDVSSKRETSSINW